MEEVCCPNCCNSYQSISHHWRYCGYPELSEKQHKLVQGGLLSDGTISYSDTERSGKGVFRIYNTNRKFLEWFDNEMGVFTTGVRINRTGEDKHRDNIASGFDTERDANYADLYCVSSRSLPIFEEMYDAWYDGSRHIPADFELSPTAAKVWYAGDGNLNWDGDSRGYVEIGCSSFDKQVVESLISEKGFNCSVTNGRLRIWSDGDRFLQWIGSAVSGMQYKWENTNRNKYDELIQSAKQ